VKSLKCAPRVGLFLYFLQEISRKALPKNYWTISSA